MRIIRSTNDFPELDEIFLSIGNFDGFHIGHKKIIFRMLSVSGEKDSMVITFSKAPLEILNPARFGGYIFPSGYKEELFRKLGISYLAMLDFNDVKDWEAEEFIEFLKSKFRKIYIFIGEDFRFGRNNVGDVRLLASKIKNVEIIENVIYEGKKVSSTLIRNLIRNGEIEKANKMLTQNFFIVSLKEKGDGMGRKIGFPTINFKINEQVLPANGVYFTLYEANSKILPSMTYVGTRPTFEGKEFRIETHIINLSKNLKIGIAKRKFHKIFFIKKIREEKRFQNLEELKNFLYNDRRIVLDLFENHKKNGGSINEPGFFRKEGDYEEFFKA